MRKAFCSLVFALVLSLVIVGVGVSDIVESGLISYWSFNEGAVTADTVRDIINGNDGAIVGAFESVGGIVGQGLRNADGAMTNYVQVASDALAGATTINAWAMAEAFTGTHYVFGHTTLPTWNNRIQIYCDADGMLDLGLGDSHARHTDIAVMEIGTWYHIALVYDNTPEGDYQVYVNGELSVDGSFAGLSDFMGFADIANDGAETGRDEGWIGAVDEVCIYDRALSADEIRQNYQAEGFTAVNPSAKLGAAWGGIKTGY